MSLPGGGVPASETGVGVSIGTGWRAITGSSNAPDSDRDVEGP
jgi:hypothetical protein